MENKAVFLSYASQDAEAARKICDALRSVGVEVWFDQSELRGGDAWDQKIRNQIKECALFMPVISANTNARAEGYFRREWRWAVDRMHDLADDHPFLVPLIIDDTPEASARVPERFRERQWTRIGAADSLDAFCERVGKLLSDGAPVGVRTEDPASPLRGYGETSGGHRAAKSDPIKGARSPLGRWIIPAIIGVVAIAGIPVWKMMQRPEQPAVSSRPTPAAPASRVEQLIASARALYEPWYLASADDFRMADGLLKQATEADPLNPEAWAALAICSAGQLYFGFDVTNVRRELLRTSAERAMKLGPESDRAKHALALYYWRQGGMNDDALRLLQELVRRDPANKLLLRMVAAILRSQGKAEESLDWLERAGALPGGDPSAWAMRGVTLVQLGRLDEAEAALIEALRLRPDFAIAQFALLGFYFFEQGDGERLRARLEAMPVRSLTDERVAMMVALLWYALREPARASDALQRVTQDYIEAAPWAAPKGLLAGRVHELAGRPDAAADEWRAALRVVEQRLAANPNHRGDRYSQLELQALLGNRAAAEAGLRAFEQLDAQQPTLLLAQWQIYALLGQEDQLFEFFTREFNRTTEGQSGGYYRAAFKFLPMMDPYRDRPRFRELAEDVDNFFAARRSQVPTPTAALSPVAAPDAKSVVVLPFANLSGDPDQEYFSDGLTEEILNALARERDLRVPGRASAFSFKGKGASAAEIAKALNVAQLVEGSVRKAGNRVRISVQLTRASDGFSEALPTVERELTDIFALQDEVAKLVVEKLTRRSTTIAPVAVLTTVPAAYDAYLRGRSLQTKTAGLRNQAAAEYERAVSLDPKFALAWARLAQARFRDFAGNYDRGPQMIEATRVAIEQALAARPDLPEALGMRAYWEQFVHHDYAAAARDFARAAALQAPTGELQFAQASLARELGQADEAFRLYREAVQLDPQNGDTTNAVALGFSLAGMFPEADRLFVQGMATQGLSSGTPFHNRIDARLRWRGPEAAVRLAELAPSDQARRETEIARALVHAGRMNEARPTYARLFAAPKAYSEPIFALGDDSTEVLSYLRALGLDEIERSRALEWREIAREQMRSGNRAPLVRQAIVRTEIALGNQDAAAEALREWHDETAKIPSAYRQNSDFARFAVGLYAQLGRPDEEIALLRQLQGDRFHRGRLGFALRGTPALTPLRNDPQFQEIVREEEAWAKAQPDPIDP